MVRNCAARAGVDTTAATAPNHLYMITAGDFSLSLIPLYMQISDSEPQVRWSEKPVIPGRQWDWDPGVSRANGKESNCLLFTDYTFG
jgi:hypothetical protein